MAGFIRRYGYFPGTEVITQIEGVIIVDAPPPGSVQGVATGVVAVVGEFADMTSAVAVDAAGNITTKIVPMEVFGSKDLIDKAGGFDETLGEWGISYGNGFAALRNKAFSRLVVVPINLCSARGVRVWRQLPVCKSQSDTNGITVTSSTVVEAGREFRAGAGRMRLGARVVFTALEPIAQGTGGAFSNGGSAPTQNFTIGGGGDWSLIARPDGSIGARKGDIIVIGYNSGGVIAPTGLGGTYRVAADAASASPLSIEKLDGTNFTTTVQTNIPWRLHESSDADSAPVRVPGSAQPGGYAINDAGGFTVPVRPLTTSTGSTSDGSWGSGTQLQPAVAAPAADGGSWDPLSGLAARTFIGSTLTFTAAVQGINPASHAALDAQYATAIDTLLADKPPARDVNLIFAARKSQVIATKLKSHAAEASSRGIGRMAIISPTLAVQSPTAVGADSYPGVGGNRAEGIVYAWPGAQTFMQEAVGFRLRTADGLTTIDGIIDDPFDGWIASLLSNLPPERNPGQAASPVPEIFAPILGLQRGAPDMGMPEYTFLRTKGIAALRIDRTTGAIIQSGITTSLVSGQKNINRRRFSYFIEDSIAQRLVQYSKLPMGSKLRDGASGECVAFCEELLSPDNPDAQRCAEYQVDDKSGNTQNLAAKGIHVIIVRVRMTPTADFIVLQAEVGDNVVIRRSA